MEYIHAMTLATNVEQSHPLAHPKKLKPRITQAPHSSAPKEVIDVVVSKSLNQSRFCLQE